MHKFLVSDAEEKLFLRSMLCHFKHTPSFYQTDTWKSVTRNRVKTRLVWITNPQRSEAIESLEPLDLSRIVWTSDSLSDPLLL